MYPLTPTVKNILIINALVFAINQLLINIGIIDLLGHLGLHYFGSSAFKIFQIFTYFFIEYDFVNLLISSLSLYFFGTMLEMDWGAKKFLNFYLLSGVLTGVCIMIIHGFFAWKTTGQLILNDDLIAVNDFVPYLEFGTRWMIFSIWTAMALLHPDYEIYLYFFIPLRVKYMWLIMVITRGFSFFDKGIQGTMSLYIMLMVAIVSYLLVKYFIKRKTSYL